LAATVFASAVPAILCICDHKKQKIALLIAQNAILHIRTAEIRDVTDFAEKATDTDIEVFVSYFGILLDSKVIKFNQDGVRLMTVQFGPDYVMLTYGTDNRMQRARLLRPAIPRKELGAIAEKFRYETGVVPDICC
jgi:hypothetical protein